MTEKPPITEMKLTLKLKVMDDMLYTMILRKKIEKELRWWYDRIDTLD